MTAIPSPSTLADDSAAISAPVPTTVMVCLTCRREADAAEAPRAGSRLHEALAAAAQGRDDVRVVGVECLSVCKRPVTIGFAGPAKWTYVYGDFDETAASEILDTAVLYGAAADGLIPWKQRPSAFKKGVVARVPPLPLSFSEVTP